MADKRDLFVEEIVDPGVPSFGAHHDHRIDAAAFHKSPKRIHFSIAAVGRAQKEVEAVIGQGSRQVGHLVDEKRIAERTKIAWNDQADSVELAGTQALSERVRSVAMGLGGFLNARSGLGADIGVAGQGARDRRFGKAQAFGELVEIQAILPKRTISKSI
jgi:hypothetical protein